MPCSWSFSMQLFYNGAASENFSPSHGIRQGDPFSWYIFCIMHGEIYSFNRDQMQGRKILMNRYLMQSAMEVVLYWYLTSKDIAERIQSKLSAWKNRQFFCSRKSRFILLLKWWWLMERLSQWLPDNCVRVILLICLSCLDNGSDFYYVEPRTRWWILILCFLISGKKHNRELKN
jgi:hypothetical protein